MAFPINQRANPLTRLGAHILVLSENVGAMLILLRKTVAALISGPLNRKNVFMQLSEMGNRTFPVASLTLVFTGMVLALQTGFTTIKIFNEPLFIGSAVGNAIAKELAPVLTAMVFAGRIGAAIAAEIGTMKVTEQIDALYTLGTNPIRYLAVPRFIGAVTMLPLLTIYADLMGVLGGYIVATSQMRFPSSIYWDEIIGMKIEVVMHGFLKSFVFALIIVTTACYRGFQTTGGAEGVGKSTTAAVVVSMGMVLISDYFVSALLIAFGIG